MSSLLENAAEHWWQWSAAMSVQVALLVLVIALLDRLLLRWAWPGLRSALWALVLLKLVLPPSLSSPFSLLEIVQPLAIGAAAATPQASPGSTLPFLLWLTGWLGLSGLAAGRYLRLRRLWLEQPALPISPELESAIRSAAHKLSLERLPRVRVQRGARGPAVLGFLRPLVVLPAQLVEDSSRQRIEHVLLHEFAHLKRRDPAASFLCLLLQLFYWYHPLVWIARRELATLREIGCDESVARALRGSTAGYRRTLLEVARPWLEPRTPGQLGFIHRHGQLLARLEWLERPLARKPLARRLSAALLFSVLAVCCLPLGRRVQSAGPLELTATDFAELEGCLQKRLAVFSMLAQAEGHGVRY